MENVFLYSVSPKKPLMLKDGTVIRVAKSVYLSKEDLVSILGKAVVYRRFIEAGVNEKVTTANIDRVHREKYVSEADWKNVQIKESSNNVGTVSEPAKDPEPEKVEEPIKDEIKTDEVSDSNESVEEVVESDDDDEIETVEVVEEENAEVESDVVEETEAVEVAADDKQDEQEDN